MNRTKNAIRNIIFGFLNKFIVLLFPFIIRSVLIKKLGSEYLGLSSLFTSILQVLNLTELGFSSAVVYCLYEPIANNNKKVICALLNFYKKIYRFIGMFVFIAGLIIMFFLKSFIKGSYPNEINIYLLYILYLINTAITYFLFAYKSTLLVAHQRSDITSNISTIVNIPMYTIQFITLYYFKNYYAFVISMIISNVINNILCAFISKKIFPEYVAEGNIDELLKKDIWKRVKGLMIQRICVVTRNSLDSIFISAFLGLNLVAIYNNYYSIISALVSIMGIFSSAVTAGIGHSIVTETENKNYNDMNKFIYIYMLIVGYITVGLTSIFQPFMKIWMGETYMLNLGTVILLCIYFYALEIGVIRGAYSDAKGLWWENRYRAIIETICNIFLNLILVKILGLNGVIIGTLISILVINFGYGSQILFKYYFKNESSKKYYCSHLKYAIVTAFACLISYLICNLFSLNNLYLDLILKGIISVIFASFIYFYIYRNNKIFNESILFIKKVFITFKRKR